MQTELQIIADELETTKAKLAAAQTATPRIANQYDVVETSTEKHRRKAKVETTDEIEMLSGLKRGKAINLTRNLQRNYSTAAGHLRQFKLNVVGAAGPKLSLLTDDATANAQANERFNKKFAKSPAAKDDTPLNEIVANVLTSVKREGDVLVVFDDFDFKDGRLIFYEADQLVNLNAADWNKQIIFPAADFSQNAGVVRDRRGTVRGWIVGPRGRTTAKLDECSLLKRDRPDDPGVARMILSPWRLNQERGVAEMLTSGADYQDSREILSKEMQSAKVASSIAGVVTKKDSSGAEEQLLQTGTDPDEIIDGDETEVVTGEREENYDRMEALTGGYMEYLAADDKFEILDFNRPNVNLQTFLEHVTRASGAALGLSKTYATLSPAGSYTAFRGDMLLAWSQFYWDQKFLERRLMDWLVEKVLKWAMKKRLIKRLPANWETKIKITWPVMPQIDPVKTELAIKQSLANATTDYEELLGPDWRNKMTKLAEQLQFANEVGLFLNREITEDENGMISALQTNGDSEQ